MKNLIIVFIGPSGSGKTSICHYLTSQRGFIQPITCTTRCQRAGEPDDAYMFLTQEQFQKKVMANQMIEYVEQFGYYYGSPKASFDVDLNMVVALTESGANKIKHIYPSRTTTILLTATRSTLLSRMCSRAPMSFFEHQSRLSGLTKADLHKHDYVLNTNQPFDKVCAAVDRILYDLDSTKVEGRISD